MPGQPCISYYLVHLCLVLVLLHPGGLEADSLVAWRGGGPGHHQLLPLHNQQQQQYPQQQQQYPQQQLPPLQQQGLYQHPSSYQRETSADLAHHAKVQMNHYSPWTGSWPAALHTSRVHESMHKRDLSNSSTISDLSSIPVSNAQTMATLAADSPDLSLNSTVCLHSSTDVVGCGDDQYHAAAAAICALDPSDRVYRLLFHPAFPSRCWSREFDECAPPVLSRGTLEDLKSGHLCADTAERVLCDIVRVNNAISKVERVLGSGFCDPVNVTSSSKDNTDCDGENTNSFSGSLNCHECKKWVVSWMCMSNWPLWSLNRTLPPCATVCSLVEEHCPFNIILEDASAAAGDPTFICEDSIIVEDLNSQEHDQCCFLPASLREVGRPVDQPQAGGYVDLNATKCADMLITLTPHCDITNSRRLSLANRTLVLRTVELVDLESNWFWDLVTEESGSSTPQQFGIYSVVLSVILTSSGIASS